MYDGAEMNTDPNKWMSPGAVAELWGSIGYRDVSLVTVRGMMERGWFEDHGIHTEEFDPGNFRVLRDDLLRAMMKELSGVMERLAEECAARGLDDDKPR